MQDQINRAQWGGAWGRGLAGNLGQSAWDVRRGMAHSGGPAAALRDGRPTVQMLCGDSEAVGGWDRHVATCATPMSGLRRPAATCTLGYLRPRAQGPSATPPNTCRAPRLNELRSVPIGFG